MLTPEEERAFLQSASNVEQVAERRLRALQSRQSVIAFVSNLQRGVSEVVQSAIGQGVGVACKAGCNHCCHARVEAIAPEIFGIARELAARPAEELNRYIQRLRIHAVAHAATHDAATAWNQQAECPFLTNDLCAIYDVRPSGCRKAHSLDVEKCKENAPEIPQDLGIVVNVEALAKGTSDAYRTLGFDASGHELGRAVLLALTDSSAESRWFSGERVFITDAPGARNQNRT